MAGGVPHLQELHSKGLLPKLAFMVDLFSFFFLFFTFLLPSHSLSEGIGTKVRSPFSSPTSPSLSFFDLTSNTPIFKFLFVFLFFFFFFFSRESFLRCEPGQRDHSPTSPPKPGKTTNSCRFFCCIICKVKEEQGKRKGKNENEKV